MPSKPSGLGGFLLGTMPLGLCRDGCALFGREAVEVFQLHQHARVFGQHVVVAV